MKQVECLVVGGGPAGLAAARTAARAGVHVMLVDENRDLGGQYYRRLPREFEVSQPSGLGKEYTEGRALIDDIRTLDIELHLDSLVWGIVDERTAAVATGEHSEWVRADTLILAPGAHDRPVPFPGWTLPGVITAGGAQNLMKAYRILPGHRVLVVGSGPLLLVVANNLLQGGAQVVGVCEAAPRRALWRHGLRLLPHLDFVKQGYSYWRQLRAAGVRMLSGHIVTSVSGTTAVTGASVARCDEDWHPVPGTERTLDVDTVVVGYGFLPSVELCRLAGCELRYVDRLDSWVPVRTPALETTIPGVFAVGDGAGVAGSAVALTEGQLAGLTVAWRLGKLGKTEYAAQLAPIARRHRRLAAFRAVMDTIYRIRPGLYTLADEETMVCRCEEVRTAEVLEAIRDGATDLNEAKAWTRLGMGRCQGRMCESSLMRLLARNTGRRLADVGRFTARMPVKPIPLAAVISAEAGEQAPLGPDDWKRLAH